MDFRFLLLKIFFFKEMNKCILFGLLLITIIGATESIDRLK